MFHNFDKTLQHIQTWKIYSLKTTTTTTGKYTYNSTACLQWTDLHMQVNICHREKTAKLYILLQQWITQCPKQVTFTLSWYSTQDSMLILRYLAHTGHHNKLDIATEIAGTHMECRYWKGMATGQCTCDTKIMVVHALIYTVCISMIVLQWKYPAQSRYWWMINASHNKINKTPTKCKK